MFFKKWPPVAILDVQKSLCFAFHTISDQYHNFYFCEVFLQNGCLRPFWMSENHFRSHFCPFQINTQLFKKLFYKMAAVGHFGCPKLTLNHISGYFRSIPIFLLFFIFYKMAAGGHFGCPKITFDLISGHFRSIHSLNFLTKWLPSAILDVRNSLCITFLAILDQYRFLFYFYFFLQNGCRWPFWMSENHFRLHFWPFQFDMQLKLFLNFFDKMAAGGHFGCPKFTFDRISGHFRWIGHFGFPKFTFDRNSGDFRSIQNFFFHTELYLSLKFFDKMAAGGHFRCPQITFYRISGHFRSIRNFFLGGFFWTNWPPVAILDRTTMSIIELVRDIWMSSACVKFEERSLNPQVLPHTEPYWETPGSPTH